MSNSFITPPIKPVLPVHNERSNSQINYPAKTNQAPSQAKLNERSAIAAALAQLDSPEEAMLMEEHLAIRMRRSSRLHDDIGMEPSEAGDQLERLLAKAHGFDEAALNTLLSSFSDLEHSPNPMAQLTAYNTDPGLAGLMMAVLLGGAESEHWERLRRKFNKDSLKKTLARYLKDHGGEIAISFFSFLEFNDCQQLDTMKELYRYASVSCRTLGELFDHFIKLKNRRKRLRALLRTLAFELSQMNGESNEHVRLMTVMEDLSQLLRFFSLEAVCAETALKLNQLIH